MDCTPKLNSVIYSDSEIARKVTCARTKTESIINKVLAPHSVDVTIECLSGISCFGVCTDGSNHGNYKVFPIILQYFDYRAGGIQTKVVEVKTTTNETSETIASYVTDTLKSLGIAEKCTAFGGDNTNTNFGGLKRKQGNNIFTKLKASLNKNLVGVGCPAHILHNTIQQGADILNIDIECIVIKLHNYFSIYTVRTEALKSYCDFVNVEHKQLLCHSKTRWLSLFPAIQRVIEMYDALKSYFSSIPNAPKVLLNFFENKLSMAYLWHLHSLMSVFNDKIKNTEKEGNCIIDVLGILEDVASLLQNRLESKFICRKAKEYLECAREEGYEKEVECFMGEAVLLYATCFEYLKKWTICLEEFTCFRWIALTGKVVMHDIQPCIDFLNEKGISIDDTKCCDQLVYLNIYLENNRTDIANMTCQEKWVSFLKSTEIVEKYSEFLKIAEYLFSIPGHNANVERLFSLMSAQWTDTRNSLDIDSVKGLLLVKYNLKNFQCRDFYNYVLNKTDLLAKVSSSDKYA